MVVLSLLLTACGGGSAPAPAPATASTPQAAPISGGTGQPPTPEEDTAAESDTAAAGEPTDTLEIAARGEQLLFDTTALGPVVAGEEIMLTFDNVSRINQHNWILIDTSDEAEAKEFNDAGGLASQAENYIPEDDSLVLARSNLLDPGQVQDLAFTAPEAGEYIYLCTVPGHFDAGMWGFLTVVE